MLGFHGHTVPGEMRDVVSEFDLGGVVYFARNIHEPAQVRELSREVAALAREWPLWIGVDQEGGRVARLKAPFTIWPPAVTLGRSGNDALAERFARALAAELSAVGINFDFAPVLDINTNTANPVIGDRALGERGDDVARLGTAIIRTLQREGIAACGKHFPGHGDTTVDSHHALPVVEHERRRLEAIEWVPFKRAIADGVAAIMTAHVLVPALDEEHPATLSRAVVQSTLKDALGFAGVVVSDDLGMKAVSERADQATLAVEAIEAGCDVALLCNSTVDEQVAAIEALIRAGESGRLSQKRLDDAFSRQRAMKERYLAPSRKPRVSLDVIGSVEHQAVAMEMASWV